MTRRNRRSGVEDLWTKCVRDEHGNKQDVPSARYGRGMRWRARYVDRSGRERSKSFGRKADAQAWLDGEIAGHVTGTWTDPKLSAVTFSVVAEISDRDGDALVFVSARGGYLTLGQARYMFTKATKAVEGCGGVRLHDLRHTCASLAIRSGANVKVVQRLLGHKTAVLTLDRYGHLYADDLHAVATAFDAAAQTTAYRLRTGHQLKPVAAGEK